MGARLVDQSMNVCSIREARVLRPPGMRFMVFINGILDQAASGLLPLAVWIMLCCASGLCPRTGGGGLRIDQISQDGGGDDNEGDARDHDAAPPALLGKGAEDDVRGGFIPGRLFGHFFNC